MSIKIIESYTTDCSLNCLHEDYDEEKNCQYCYLHQWNNLLEY